MKKISLLLATILTLAIVLCGCGSANMDASYNGGMANKDMADSLPAPSADVEMDSSSGGLYDKAGSTNVSADSIYENPDNKIIRTASMTIQTTEFDVAVENLNRLTEQYGGYYESARVESGGYYDRYVNRSGYYIVRIPRENFVAFRDGTGGIGHVYSIYEDAQNVGEQYYDTEARLATLTTKRDRLLALLEKAELMEDIITLNNALADVQYEIDMHTSTLRKYDSLIGYSTFTIHLQEVAKIEEQPAVTETFGSRFLSNLKRGFENFADGLQDFALWFARNLIGVVIFVAVVVVVVVIVVRRVRRRKQKQKAE